ncbi:TonB-dependent receptor plug domain-containing protein [Sporomusa aerivorans]|uniref:TonB-dependent receptor plug domain-containing protein n=1 Tax=Sporomusa aerivorans TaxID=204936 RepID=UPI00352B4741
MNKTKKQLLCSLISSAVLLSIPQASWAEEADVQEYALDEYVVTANRVPVKRTEIAANVEVITRAEIEKGGFTSVPEILRKSNVTLEQNRGATVPLLNGDDRVLILVDGRRMNWSHLVVSGSDHAGKTLDLIPVDNIERIEVVHGPASSLYGSDAVGGVINIITRKATSSQTAVTSEFGSWGFERYGLTSQGKADDISYLFTYEKKKQDNFEYKDPKTGQTKTHADTQQDQQFMTLRLDKELTGGRSLTLQLEHTEDESGFAGYLKEDGTSVYPGGYRINKDNNIALTYQWGKDAGLNNSLRVYHNRFETTHYKSLSATYDLAATGVDWQQNWKLGENHTLVGGTEWRQEKLEDHVSIDKAFTTGAIFVEDRWKLPSDWTLSLGTRYNHHSEAGGHFTTRLSANREINATTNVYASWGQYVKNPTLAQMYSNTIFWKGNPDLSPETGNTITIGINTELGNGTKLQASAYRSHIKDAIDWAWKDWEGNGTEYTKYTNVDNEKRRGVDISLTRQLSPQWSVSGGYSYVNIQSKSDTATQYSDDPRNSQPNSYRLNIEYDQDKWNSILTLRRATGRDLTKFTGKAYTALDMVLNYKMNDHTRAFLKCYNLTNEAYETTGSTWSTTTGEFPMPSRSFYLGLEQKF